jgi:hypothetical protein
LFPFVGAKFLCIGILDKRKFRASLITQEGFRFNIKLYSCSGVTIITSRKWKEFAKVYELKGSDILTFII